MDRRVVAAVVLIGAVGAGLRLWKGMDRRAEDVAAVPLSRRLQPALPGFSIALPVGATTEERLDYPAGKLQLALPDGRGAVAIEWQIGAGLGADEFEALAVTPLRQVLSLQLDERGAIEVPGVATPGTRYVLHGGAKDISMALSTWRCGARWFTLTVGIGRRAATLEQRIRASFACTPDRALESASATLPIQADLPGFGLSEDGADQLILASLDSEAVTFTRTGARLEPGDLGQTALMAKLLETAAGLMGITDLVVGPPVNEVRGGHTTPIWRSRGTLDGTPVRLLLALFDCDAGRYAGLYLAPTALPEARGLDVLVPVRCAGPGETPSRPRAVDVVFAEACAAGDRRGCPE